MQQPELIVDCETNGFLENLSKVHSLCIENEEHAMFSCHDHGAYRTVEDGLRLIMNGAKNGAVIVMHNGIKFDYWALKKVYPWFDIPVEQIRDTLVLARLLWADIAVTDAKRVAKGFPKKLIGSHSLKAWGYRLGILKGEFGETSDWQEWSKDMQEYCELDVRVTRALWELIKKKQPAARAVQLETWFAFIMSRQEQFGYTFDKDKAVALYLELMAKRQEIDGELKKFFGSWYVSEGEVIPKVNNGPRGITKGVPYTKIKLVEFNPGSRQHIANRLTKLYGWKPKVFTESGQPQVDESILTPLPYPPAKLLADRFLLEKRIGQLAEGENAWLKLERNGRIHGSVNTIGAVTGRCTHNKPNMAQVPSVRALYGPQCRELFRAPDGMVQIGADASGLELRCLAHYMARYDGGSYTKAVTEGDVHWVNTLALGLVPPGTERDSHNKDHEWARGVAKTFIYAFLYGAGDEKIGSIVGKGAKEGKRLKARFLQATPAIARLREAVGSTVKQKGYLVGIDGRILKVRSEHAALNTLLQSAGALLVKQATVNLYQELTRRGLVWGLDWAMVAHVHDEYQLHVKPEVTDLVSEVAVWSFQQAGRDFNWRCPLGGEAKTGLSWKDCH